MQTPATPPRHLLGLLLLAALFLAPLLGLAADQSSTEPPTPLPYLYPDPIDRQGRDWEAKAIAAVDAGDWVEVVRTATLALRRNDEALSAYINRGLAFWNMGDIDKALADWNRAVALSPQNGEALFNRGLAWQAKGRGDLAAADLHAACRQDILPACLAVGDTVRAMTVDELLAASVDAFTKADYNEVLHLSDAVLAREPANPVALTNRCGALVSLHRPDEAMEYCERAMDLAPEFGLAYNNFGVAWEQKGDPVSARVYYELACRRGTRLGCDNRDRLSVPPGN